MHWHADYILLWQEPARDREVLFALHYYFNTVGVWSDKYIATLFTVVSIQISVLLFHIFSGKETNWLFDGASLFLVAAVATLYKTKLLPLIDIIPSITPPPASQPLSHYAEALSSLREVANAHVLLAMALLGIVLLQCGKFYSERLQERERNEEVDARLLRRLRQLQQEERSKSNTEPPAMAPSAGGPDAST
ncbi:hypothetical protein MBRA1_000563 [Malassezia brasiliensis]|uniref:Uncharacterized protein n=1 Tax=Malassezia brasiliensis TaxID=1821822 RepID=A0AAF0DR67_9BASI|nr:hypothetical protein MBRA1_000563 [Malassezia brasiliensis]